MRSPLCALGCSVAMLTTSCGGDGGTGTVEVSVWGEEYIEQGIPTSDFADGWSASFDRFVIVLGDVTLENADGGRAVVGGLSVYDLVTAGPHAVGTTEPLDATSWSRVGYRMAVATPDTEVHPSASDDDRALMRDQGYSVYVEGSASDGKSTKTQNPMELGPKFLRVEEKILLNGAAQGLRRPIEYKKKKTGLRRHHK